MAGIQALINQKTGTPWGNPNPFYYSIAAPIMAAWQRLLRFHGH